MEEEKGLLCRETFVREAIRAMEKAMKTTRTTTKGGGFTKEEEEEEEGSTFIKTVFFGGEDDDECAERCVEKMRFDYPDATRKELETLGRSVEERTRGATTTTTKAAASGVGVASATKTKPTSCEFKCTFDSKVLENIALGATKTTTEENNSNAMKDAYRKLAIQVYVEFPLRLLEEEKEAKEIEAILGEVDFSEEEEERQETQEPGLEDVMAFAEENGVEKKLDDVVQTMGGVTVSMMDASNGCANDEFSTDDDDDVANWIPLEMGCGAMNNGLNKSNGKEKCTRTFTRIEKAQFLLRKLTPALIGADECARVSDGSAPYVSRKTTEKLADLFEKISQKIQSNNSTSEEQISSYRTMRSAVMNCLRSRFLVSPNDIVANECLKRVMKSLRFGEYAKRSALEKKMNADDGVKEDESDAMALLAHLAVRFAEKNALGANFSVFGQFENTAPSSNLSNARRVFAPLVADSLVVIATRFWSFAGTEKEQKEKRIATNIDEEDASMNACALLLSYAFTSNTNTADGMILSSGCIASLASYFSSKGVLKEDDDDASSYFTPGSAAARRCISIGIASSKAMREYFSKAPMCVSASKLDAFVNSSHGVIWSLAVDADEEEAAKRMKHISATHSNSIEMLNTILIVSACFASANSKGTNNGLWKREGVFHKMLEEILASTKEVEEHLVEVAKRRIAERRGQNEKKRNESDADDDVEEGDHGEKKATYASLSDAKIDPELEKARDIATMSRRVLKDLVAASTFGDIAAIRKSD